jgi:hypothetical protein
MCCTPTRTPLEEQLVREALAMAGYALASGKALPPRVAETLQDSLLACNPDIAPDSERTASTVRELTWAHAQLTQLVAPAAPRAVLLLAPPPGGEAPRTMFGPIRLVRYLLLVSLVSLICLLFLGATEEVTGASKEVFFDLNGLPSLANAAFLLCAASIGASFSALFRINLYIAATTYDPKHDVSYWVQYGLGLIAGVLLATMIPISDAAGPAISRSVLALVGGFSASLLYRTLDRLSRSIESLVAAHPTGDSLGPPPASSTEELQTTVKQLLTLFNKPEEVETAPVYAGGRKANTG